MRLSKLITIFVFAAVVFISGCRVAPVYNVDSSAIPAANNVTDETVKTAIIRAGFTLGWTMKADKPGHIVGTLNLRKHVAVVDINYSKASYSIKYKDSVELDYDGTNIHSNYNGWVQKLDRQIKIQLSTI